MDKKTVFERGLFSIFNLEPNQSTSNLFPTTKRSPFRRFSYFEYRLKEDLYTLIFYPFNASVRSESCLVLIFIGC